MTHEGAECTFHSQLSKSRPGLEGTHDDSITVEYFESHLFTPHIRFAGSPSHAGAAQRRAARGGVSGASADACRRRIPIRRLDTAHGLHADEQQHHQLCRHVQRTGHRRRRERFSVGALAGGPKCKNRVDLAGEQFLRFHIRRGHQQRCSERHRSQRHSGAESRGQRQHPQCRQPSAEGSQCGGVVCAAATGRHRTQAQCHHAG